MNLQPLPFTQEERNVLSCFFDGNYWTVDEIVQSVGGAPDRTRLFITQLESDGWVERFDDESPAMWRRFSDEVQE